MNIQQAFEEARKQGYPKFYDGDLICNICGEPWEAWGIRQKDSMNMNQAKKFKAGKGCPCCKGEKKIE